MVLYCCAFNCKEKYVKGGPYTFHRLTHTLANIYHLICSEILFQQCVDPPWKQHHSFPCYLVHNNCLQDGFKFYTSQ
ncbi:unnamed protein product, partial [Larinioides sclopetarius]